MYFSLALAFGAIQALAHPGLELRQASNTTSTAASPTGTGTSSGNDTGLAGVTGVSGNVTAFAKLWGWEGCSTAQKSAVLQGLEEAHTMLRANGIYYISDHFNDYATVEFLGDPRRAYKSRSEIQGNFDRAYNYQQHWYSFSDTQVFCLDDDQGYCANEPGYIAVENNYDKYGLALGFCARWFKLGTFKAIYDSASSDPSTKWDMSNYENRARPWVTTMMRINKIGKWPTNGLTVRKVRFPDSPFFQWVTSASQTKFLAKNAGTTDNQADVKTLANPDNWSWFAMAQYVQMRLGNYASLPQTPDDLAPSPFVTLNGSITTDDPDLDAIAARIPW